MKFQGDILISETIIPAVRAPSNIYFNNNAPATIAIAQNEILLQ